MEEIRGHKGTHKLIIPCFAANIFLWQPLWSSKKLNDFKSVHWKSHPVKPRNKNFSNKSKDEGRKHVFSQLWIIRGMKL